MECIRGVYAYLRNRGSHRTAGAAANSLAQDSNGNKRPGTQESMANGEAHRNEPSGLRKFFGSLLSIRSRASNQAFHFENETVKEENGGRLAEDIHEHDGGQNSFEYSRKVTAVVIENQNVNENESNEPGVFYDNEAADIVPYVVAEERMEEGDLAENVGQETEFSDNDNEIGDTDIYPYPQTTRTVNRNQRMREDSEIEVILSTNIPIDNSKQFRGKKEGSFGTESSRVRKKSSDASSGDVSVDQVTVVHDISNEDTTQGDTDTESNEIYVSRNIPVELTKETLDIGGRNSEGKSKTRSDSGSGSIENVYPESDSNQVHVNIEDNEGPTGNSVQAKEIRGEKGEDRAKEDIEIEGVESEGMLEKKVYSSDTKLPRTENAHNDAEISESENIRSNPEDVNKDKATEKFDLSEKEQRNQSEGSGSDHSVDADDDLSQGSSHGAGESESIENRSSQKESPENESDQSETSENDSDQSESSENESDQSEDTGSQSEAEGECEIDHTASQDSLPTSSYMKNNIQVTIIGEVEEGIVEDHEDRIDRLSRPKDVDTASVSSETNKYQVI